jgi:hypothetical protein
MRGVMRVDTIMPIMLTMLNLKSLIRPEILVLGALTLTSCSSKEGNDTNSELGSLRVKEAKAKCQVEMKLRVLKQNKDSIENVTYEETKQLLRDAYKSMERKVYSEINDCLAVEGVKLRY